MEFRRYSIKGLVLIVPKVFGDHRGFFMETYHQRAFAEAGIALAFVQDNHSRSHRGTLRGLHYQIDRPQAKLVRCVRGSIYDVAVDIRPGSPTWGQWVGELLDEDNKHQLLVPAGFAHGFQVLSETAEVVYKCSDFYSPPGERGIRWDDPELAIDWPLRDGVLLSDKDQQHPFLSDLNRSELERQA